MRVGITGHQHIPPVAAEDVLAMLGAVLEEDWAPLTGVTSLAEGADQMFAALVLQRGGRLHAVVPCRQYQDSFSSATGVEQFRALLARTATIETLDFPDPSEQAFLAAGRHVADLSDVLVAVWDGQAARGVGGTADIVAYARERGVNVRVLWPRGVSR
jgi:hypothetical protein